MYKTTMEIVESKTDTKGSVNIYNICVSSRQECDRYHHGGRVDPPAFLIGIIFNTLMRQGELDTIKNIENLGKSLTIIENH